MKIRKTLTTGSAIAALSLGMALPASAQPNQVAGAGGLVTAIIQVDRTLNDLVDVDIEDSNIEVITVSDSLNNNNVLNNLLRNARFLNNIDVLRDSTILTDILNNADVDVNVEDVLAIDVLSDGTIVVYQA